MMMYLSGPQPDNPAHEDITQIAPRRSIQGTPWLEEPRLPTSKVGMRRSPARPIERLPFGEGVRGKLD